MVPAAQRRMERSTSKGKEREISKKISRCVFYQRSKKNQEIARVEKKPSFLFQLIIDGALEKNDRVCIVVGETQFENEFDVYRNVSLERFEKVIILDHRKLEWKNSVFSQHGEFCRDLVSGSMQGLASCNHNQTCFWNMLLAQAQDNQRLKIDLKHYFDNHKSKMKCRCKEISGKSENPFFDRILCPEFISLVPADEAPAADASAKTNE